MPPGPISYVIHRPTGDPGAVRRLVAAYEGLADAVELQTRAATNAMADLLQSWIGAAANAATRPHFALRDDGARAVHMLRGCAAELRRYAAELERAHEHHGWSIGRLVAMGAMVTVGAAAIVVTVGAAAPVEAAAAAAVVEGAEAATSAAGVAEAGVAETLLSCEGALAVLRPLAPFVVPHLGSAATSTGIEAALELLQHHRLDPHSLEVAAGVGFASSTLAGAAERHLSEQSVLMRRGAEATAWAAAGATGQYADSGSVDPWTTVGQGAGGFVARDVRRGADHLRRLWRTAEP